MLIDKDGLLEITLSKRQGLNVNYDIVVNTKAINSALKDIASSSEFQIKNFGQAAQMCDGEVITCVINDYDSGTQDTITITPIQIDGFKVKAGGSLAGNYDIKTGTIACIEPLWKRPFVASPSCIWVFTDGLYGLKAKCYVVDQTVDDIWNLIQNGLNNITNTITQTATGILPQINELDIINTSGAGSVFTVSLNGESVEYIVQTGDTNDDIAAGIDAAITTYIGANPASDWSTVVTVSVSINTVTITGVTDNVPFTVDVSYVA